MTNREQQQAMKELKHMIAELKADTATFNHPLSRQLVHTLSVAVDCLETALSQPERPKGRWRTVWHGEFIATLECSVCGRRLNVDYPLRERAIKRKYPYCHCGADMQGVEE